MKLLMLGFFLMLSKLSYAQSPCASGLPRDICDFETKVYTELNFKNTQELRRVMVELKNLLMKHSKAPALVQDHILTLGERIVEEAYQQRAPKKILALADGQRNLTSMLPKLRQWEQTHGQIVPLDWRLPQGFAIGVTSLNRSYQASSDHLRFSMSFFSVLDRPLDIEQFKISRYGGQVLIDKAAGVGDWDQGVFSAGGRPFASASSAQQDTPMPDGLYTMTIKLKGEKAVEGWFFLHGTATTSPIVLSPQVNERFTTSNPIFRFQDFASSSRLKSDSRKTTVTILREGDNKQMWKTSYINPTNLTSVSIRDDKNQTGDESLVTGSYRVRLSFEERSYFGDLTIGRVTNTTVPFAISK